MIYFYILFNDLHAGLVVSYSLVEYAVVTISLDYLSDTWGKEHLGKASAIINFQDGVSAVSAVIVAHIADSCVGRFNMIVICTLSYITVSLCSVLV